MFKTSSSKPLKTRERIMLYLTVKIQYCNSMCYCFWYY